VPVDWSEPDGETLSLAVRRYHATDTPVGTMLFNPGGPGASGVDFMSTVAAKFGKDLLGEYDVVGWDPRGVGGSAPLSCPEGANAELARVDNSPDTLEERLVLERVTESWMRACQEVSGPVFAHVDTVSNVRDLDVLRTVLGQEKLMFGGFSYGSRIGLFYADMFPEKVGRLVLDSTVDPASDNREFLATQAVGIERALDDYLTDCPTRTGCPLATVPAEEGRARVAQVIRDADTAGTDAQTRLVNVLAELLKVPTSWPDLDQVLTMLLQGDTSVLDSIPEDVDIANTAINCMDLPDSRTAQQVLHDAADTARSQPVFGHEVTSGTPCPQWPVNPAIDPHDVTASGSAPILVVATTRDTSTPFEWAQTVVSHLDNSRLLIRDASGHIGYSRSPCITTKVDHYLINGQLPAEGTVCSD
jgi:pimeloyl-ACP methyl ester carboxylesterase